MFQSLVEFLEGEGFLVQANKMKGKSLKIS